MFSKFCFRRVVVAHDDGTPVSDREPVWLVIEWPDEESRPTKFTLTTLPRRMSKKLIARTIKERWRYGARVRELKGELGLDHYRVALSRVGITTSRRPLLLRVSSSANVCGLSPLGETGPSRSFARPRA